MTFARHRRPVAATGLWLDTRTRQITTDEPAEGIQLVAQGEAIPPKYLPLMSDAGAGVETATEPSVETATDPHVPDTSAVRDEPDTPGDLRHLGGGWYELPDGRRIRGRDEALDALRPGD